MVTTFVVTGTLPVSRELMLWLHVLERLHDKYLRNVLIAWASLKCYTVEPLHITLQASNISASCVKNASSTDEKIPTFIQLRSKKVAVPSSLDGILG